MEDFIKRLQESVRRRPFEPFDFEWPNGDRITCDDPEAIAIRGNVAIFIGPDGRSTLLSASGAQSLKMPATPWRPPDPLPMPMRGLLVMQLLGICGAVLAATIEIESIVGSGPIFSITGLVVAECGRRVRSWALFGLGASTLALSLFVFALINLANWSPEHARLPVSLLLLMYEGLIVPMGLLMLWRSIRPAPPELRSWQFDLKSLFWLMGFLAIGLAAGRIATDMGLSPLSSTAAVLLAATLAALAWMFYQGNRLHAPREEELAAGREMSRI